MREVTEVRQKITLLPITSQVVKAVKISPVVVKVKSSKNNGLDRDSTIIAIEPNTFDKKRLVKYLGQLETESLQEVKQKLQIYLNI